jgi:hypothetical protein
MSDAAAFAAAEAIRTGEWDEHLTTLEVLVKRRWDHIIHDHTTKPSLWLPEGQVWVWMNEPVNRWEPRGTGVVLE